MDAPNARREEDTLALGPIIPLALPKSQSMPKVAVVTTIYEMNMVVVGQGSVSGGTKTSENAWPRREVDVGMGWVYFCEEQLHGGRD